MQVLTLLAFSLVQALDDEIPEVRRVYQLTLTSATPGAGVSPLAREAAVTMAASDLPHGLFSLPPGQLSVSEEEGKVRSSPRNGNPNRKTFQNGTDRKSTRLNSSHL